MGMIILSVEDNGTGIPSEIQTKIFDQFFTTKDSSKGIGIGLATIKKIVEEEFLGRIILDSEVFVGSRFTIIFPSKHEPASGNTDKGNQPYEETSTS